MSTETKWTVQMRKKSTFWRFLKQPGWYAFTHLSFDKCSSVNLVKYDRSSSTWLYKIQQNISYLINISTYTQIFISELTFGILFTVWMILVSSVHTHHMFQTLHLKLLLNVFHSHLIRKITADNVLIIYICTFKV